MDPDTFATSEPTRRDTQTRGERALQLSEVDDEMEALDRADRKWSRVTFPVTLAVAAILYLVLTVIGANGLGLWVLTNVLLVLAVLHAGHIFRDRKRYALGERRGEIIAIPLERPDP